VSTDFSSSYLNIAGADYLFICNSIFFFFVDFHSFLNIQIYKTSVGTIYQGILTSGKFFASFV